MSHILKFQARFALVTILLLFATCAMALTKHKSKPHHHHTKKHSRHVSKSGNAVERRSNGRVSDVHNEKRHMDIHNGLNGDRRVSTERADHSRIVAERGRRGFVERPYSYHGHDYYRRTFYYHGHAYDRYYRGAFYHGVSLHVYAPYHYYSAGFYGWAYHPWRTHVVYAWGWGGRPWYGYYGYYFAPYPVYTSGAAWLTDYMLSNDLQAAYDAGHAAGSADAGTPADAAGPMLTPQMKDLIANEVQEDLEIENLEQELVNGDKDSDPASSGIPRLLSDGKPHVFVVGDSVEVVNEATDEDCSLSEGDLLQITTPPDADEKDASLQVLASKSKSECPVSADVTVTLDELQEMQNHMREAIDAGMEELQKKQGTDGLPAAPQNVAQAVTTAPFAPLAPPPDPNDAATLDQQMKDSDQSEKEAVSEEKQEVPQQPPAPIERATPTPHPQ
jgi:hypothetical protein